MVREGARRATPVMAALALLPVALRACGTAWGQPVADRPALPPELWLSIGAGAYALLAGGVLVGLWHCRRAMVGRAALLPALLTGLALALRLIPPGGPSDIRPVLENPGPQRAGWAALLHLLQLGTPLHDDLVWNINRVAGALAVPLLYAVLRRRFADPLVAAAGATALAVTPLLVRFAATDAPYILQCAALFGALVAWDRFGRSGAAGPLLLAFGLLTAALQLRPEGPWLLVPATLLALAAADQPGLRRFVARPPALVILILPCVILLNAVPILWSLGGHTYGTGLRAHVVVIGALLGSPWADAPATPAPLALLVLAGAVVALVRRERASLLWLLAVALALPLAAPATGAAGGTWASAYGYAIPSVPAGAEPFSQYANARYHLPAMALACGLIGLAGAAIVRRATRWWPRTQRWAVPAAVALVLLAALPRAALLRMEWTPQREFVLLRDGLARIDATCRVAALIETRDAGFVPFEYLAPRQLIDLAPVLARPDAAGCLYYYRGGNCFTRDLVPESEWARFEMHPLCRDFERRHALEPVLVADVPALPFRGESYTRDPLPLGLYRVRGAVRDAAAAR